MYRLCTRFDQIIKNGKSIIIPPIFDFVSLIDNAEMVITDSFHATAFSLNLNTEPICVLPDKYTNRISEFLEYVGCSQRIVKDYNDIEVINRHVDFNYVNEILKKDGTLEFKTDNRVLFDFSVEEVEPAGWKIAAITYDLHNDEKMNEGNIMTEYEERFSGMGTPINKFILER